METLKGLIVRIKTDGVKDSVEKLATLIEALLKSRDEIRSEKNAIIIGERSRAEAMATDN